MSDIAEPKVYSRIFPKDCAGLTINDAADYIGIGRSTTYTLIETGKIKTVKGSWPHDRTTAIGG